jgi:hypothetical protein
MRRIYQIERSACASIAGALIPLLPLLSSLHRPMCGELIANVIAPLGRPDTKVLANCEPGAALMNYSIQYKSGQGLTSHSEFLPFATDLEAIAHGRAGSGSDAITEVWKGDNLLVRLFGIDTPQPTTGPA